MSSFGEALRRERELREITLREISRATKIGIRYLEAMERNEFSSLPGGVFNRGFVRAYCQHIGVDSDAMVNAYLLEERSQSAAKSANGELLRGSASARQQVADAEEAASSKHRLRLWLLLGLALLAISLFFVVRLLGGAPPATGDTGHAPRQPAAGAAVGSSIERNGMTT